MRRAQGETCTHEHLDFIVFVMLHSYVRTDQPFYCTYRSAILLYVPIGYSTVRTDRPFYCTYRLWHECGVMLKINDGRFVTFQ